METEHSKHEQGIETATEEQKGELKKEKEEEEEEEEEAAAYEEELQQDEKEMSQLLDGDEVESMQQKLEFFVAKLSHSGRAEAAVEVDSDDIMMESSELYTNNEDILFNYMDVDESNIEDREDSDDENF